MYPVFPTRPETVHPPVKVGARDVLEAVKSDLALLAPWLDLRSPRGKMTVLVAAAAVVGRNVDRLANITRIERETVAKFCRRLFDGGVDPAEMGRGHPDFWNVVALAEGRLARRVDDDGRVEWVPVGTGPRDAEHERPTSRPLGAAPLDEEDERRTQAPPARRGDDMADADDEGWTSSPDRRGRAARSAAELFPDAEWLT